MAWGARHRRPGGRRGPQQAAHARTVSAPRAADAVGGARPLARRALRCRGGFGFPAVVKPEFGAAQMGCVRVDDFATLPGIYRLVRGAASVDNDAIFRAGNDLLLEEYLDGVEFDVDLVMEDGECVFSSALQNWPTAEPSFQEQGLHCPPDHNRRAVRRVIAFSIEAAQAFGLHTGVLHIEAKATSRGPRIVEINARMGGGRIYETVRAVWNLDLVEAQLRASLGLRQQLQPSRRPRCSVLNELVYAPASGRLQALPLREVQGSVFAKIDVEAAVGEMVSGPDRVFATCLAEITLSGRDLADARASSGGAAGAAGRRAGARAASHVVSRPCIHHRVGNTTRVTAAPTDHGPRRVPARTAPEKCEVAGSTPPPTTTKRPC